VAGGLIDLSLATQCRFERQHGDTIRLFAAITATFADRRVDMDTSVGIWELAAFSATPFFRRAGLIIDQHRYARDRCEIALNAVEIAAVPNFDAGRRATRCIFRGLVGNDDTALHALGQYLCRHLSYGQSAVELLTASHGDRI